MKYRSPYDTDRWTTEDNAVRMNETERQWCTQTVTGNRSKFVLDRRVSGQPVTRSEVRENMFTFMNPEDKTSCIVFNLRELLWSRRGRMEANTATKIKQSSYFISFITKSVQ